MFSRLNIVVVSLVLLGSFSGCSKHEQPAATSSVPTASATKFEVGQKAHCPVSGEDFVVKAETAQVEHDGKHYAFCCPDCQPAFTKNPAKYAVKN
jgi:YHS domain-containing protein